MEESNLKERLEKLKKQIMEVEEEDEEVLRKLEEEFKKWVNWKFGS